MQGDKRKNDNLSASTSSSILSRIGWGVLGVVAFFVIMLVISALSPPEYSETISLGQLARDVQDGHIISIVVYDSEDIVATYLDGTKVGSSKSPETNLIQALGYEKLANVPFSYQEEPGDNTSAILLQILIGIVPIIIIIWLLWMMAKSIQQLLAEQQSQPPTEFEENPPEE